MTLSPRHARLPKGHDAPDFTYYDKMLEDDEENNG
jgi:hypothetical protein